MTLCATIRLRKWLQAANVGLPTRSLSSEVRSLGDADLGADFLELLLDRLGFFLGHAFLDRLGRALRESLGPLQAEAGDLADDLDDLDLLAAGLRQRNVELGFLL